MLYSPRYNFAFIHIPKAAGTSVIVYLKKVIPDIECIGRHHNSITDLNTLQLQSDCPCGLVNKERKAIPSISIQETIFLAVVRDPIELWQSHYNWGIQKTGLYKETFMAGIFNLIYKLKGSSRSAFTDFNDFLMNGHKKVPLKNRFFKGHLNIVLHDRLSVDGNFPKKLFLIKSTDLNQMLPIFTKEVLQINSDGVLENKNTVHYKREVIKPPEFLVQKEKWYYNNEYKKYLFNPKLENAN